VLLYLVLLSTWLLSGLSARFSTGATANDAARVAKFDVTESSTMSRNFAVTMKPGAVSEDITVQVQNSSETAVRYTIAFELNGNLPLTVAPKTAAGSSGNTTENDAAASLSQESGKLIWKTKNAEMAGSKKEYTFQLQWPAGSNNYQYAEGIESVTVEITAVQED
jgi:hypothetical protein